MWVRLIFAYQRRSPLCTSLICVSYLSFLCSASSAEDSSDLPYNYQVDPSLATMAMDLPPTVAEAPLLNGQRLGGDRRPLLAGWTPGCAANLPTPPPQGQQTDWLAITPGGRSPRSRCYQGGRCLPPPSLHTTQVLLATCFGGGTAGGGWWWWARVWGGCHPCCLSQATWGARGSMVDRFIDPALIIL
jgi:hypothetical protein